MSPSDRVGWWTLIGTVALVMFALGFGACIEREAHAAAPTLRDNIIAAVPSVGSKKEPTVNAVELADVILEVSKGDRPTIAFLLALGASESGWSERIRLGQLRPREGDSYHDRNGDLQHASWGVLQVKINAYNRETWGSVDLRDQIVAGARLARGAAGMCRISGVPFPLGAFRVLGGLTCGIPLRGEDARMALYARLMRRL